MTHDDPYSKVLRQTMSERRISIAELAKRAGVSAQTVANMREGRNASRRASRWRPSAPVVIAIAEALGEPKDKWLTMTGHDPRDSMLSETEIQTEEAKIRVRLHIIESLHKVKTLATLNDISSYVDAALEGNAPVVQESHPSNKKLPREKSPSKDGLTRPRFTHAEK